MKRILQLKERKRVLLQQKEELVREFQRIQDELKEIDKEIKDEKLNIEETDKGEFKEQCNEEIEGLCEQNTEESYEQDTEQEALAKETRVSKRKRKEINNEELIERIRKRQKRQEKKEEEVKRMIEEQQNKTSIKISDIGKQKISTKNLADKYKTAIVKSEKILKRWLEYAKGFEEEVKKEKNRNKISEWTARKRVYDEMMKFLITTEETKEERKRIRNNLKNQTKRALESWRIYKRQLKENKEEQE